MKTANWWLWRAFHCYVMRVGLNTRWQPFAQVCSRYDILCINNFPAPSDLSLSRKSFIRARECQGKSLFSFGMAKSKIYDKQVFHLKLHIEIYDPSLPLLHVMFYQYRWAFTVGCLFLPGYFVESVIYFNSICRRRYQNYYP